MSDHAEVLDTSTGLDSRKLAIWTFIGSECMFFASLISNYLVHKEQWMSGPGPFPHEAWTDPATGKVLEPIIEAVLVIILLLLVFHYRPYLVEGVVLVLANILAQNVSSMQAR